MCSFLNFLTVLPAGHTVFPRAMSPEEIILSVYVCVGLWLNRKGRENGED
jgi:hypothetical protein